MTKMTMFAALLVGAPLALASAASTTPTTRPLTMEPTFEDLGAGMCRDNQNRVGAMGSTTTTNADAKVACAEQADCLGYDIMNPDGGSASHTKYYCLSRGGICDDHAGTGATAITTIAESTIGTRCFKRAETPVLCANPAGTCTRCQYKGYGKSGFSPSTCADKMNALGGDTFNYKESEGSCYVMKCQSSANFMHFTEWGQCEVYSKLCKACSDGNPKTKTCSWYKRNGYCDLDKYESSTAKYFGYKSDARDNCQESCGLCQQPGWVLGAPGTDTCPSGTEKITKSYQCEDAAAPLEYQNSAYAYKGTDASWSGGPAKGYPSGKYPSGCYTYSGGTGTGVWFGTANPSGRNARATPLCKVRAPTTTTLTTIAMTTSTTTPTPTTTTTMTRITITTTIMTTTTITVTTIVATTSTPATSTTMPTPTAITMTTQTTTTTATTTTTTMTTIVTTSATTTMAPTPATTTTLTVATVTSMTSTETTTTMTSSTLMPLITTMTATAIIARTTMPTATMTTIATRAMTTPTTTMATTTTTTIVTTISTTATILAATTSMVTTTHRIPTTVLGVPERTMFIAIDIMDPIAFDVKVFEKAMSKAYDTHEVNVQAIVTGFLVSVSYQFSTVMVAEKAVAAIAASVGVNSEDVKVRRLSINGMTWVVNADIKTANATTASAVKMKSVSAAALKLALAQMGIFTEPLVKVPPSVTVGTQNLVVASPGTKLQELSSAQLAEVGRAAGGTVRIMYTIYHRRTDVSPTTTVVTSTSKDAASTTVVVVSKGTTSQGSSVIPSTTSQFLGVLSGVVLMSFPCVASLVLVFYMALFCL